MSINCLALDFGASSVRLILGKYDGEKIEIAEIHRFLNEPVVLHGRVYWDFLRLFHEVKIGLKKVSKLNLKIQSIGVDTWGVDYGFLDKNGDLMQNPIHYRDKRTFKAVEDVHKIISFDEIYKTTGIQYMNLNTIYQLVSDKEIRDDIYEKADKFLMIPDLFNYFLCGEKVNEYTEATTSSLIDINSKKWSNEILNKLGLRSEIFCNIAFPGTILGKITKEIEDEVSLKNINVIAISSHDTASAVSSIPFDDENSAFLISGTWSLMGKKLNDPIITVDSMRNNFTNEGLAENKIAFLKNITGLWIIQQLKKSIELSSGKNISFNDIIEAAKDENNKDFFIDVSSYEFLLPLNMAEAIADHCEKKGQERPKTLGEHAIAVYNGLVYQYKLALDDLELLTKTQVRSVNMVGGGIQDEFLCQMTANTIKKPVIAGPVEASIVGNILIQLMALGEIQDLNQGREIIKNSFDVKIYDI